MNTKTLLHIAVRNQAIYIANDKKIQEVTNTLNKTTSVLLANAQKLGFTFSEALLRQLNATTPTYKNEVLEMLKEVTGTKKNWTPLVKGWDVPTGETVLDHLITVFANAIGSKKGTTLPCGHLIPEGTFPLDRYNGCPFCGTPFEFGEIENYGQGSKLKVLELWTNEDAHAYFMDLLQSKTALDATQVDSLKQLLTIYTIPEGIKIGMKETTMLVVDTLVEKEEAATAGKLFKTPTDILRYLWYKHTGFLQIIEPKTIAKRQSKNAAHIHRILDKSASAKLKSKADLKLKYSRQECRRVAQWLNELPMKAAQACEIMHPKRGMWVRFIRALRLAEYSKKKGFENLAELLDVFYNEKYTVFQGRVNYYRLRQDANKTFSMLKKRPGLFARSLFSNMLWFGAEETLAHFREVLDKIPARLVLTLNMYAQNYFNPNMQRSVKPLGGTNKRIPANGLLKLYNAEDLKAMQEKIEQLCIEAIQLRFEGQENNNETIYIGEGLYKIPLSIGDRSESVQDLPSALMGTRFPLEGSTVRLFMQWGQGLPAQHLDMDLSCRVAYPNKSNFCSFSKLNIIGCKHSGDIRSIPNKVGTAEYIDIDVDALARDGAKYVSFTCNAYSNGSITPNLVVGWMDSKFPMKISAKTGVAYDPSCVQHQVRITQGLAKGLVFGVLDIEAREVVWLEMSFVGQVVQNLDVKGVEVLLAKLDSKMNIGHLLELKATAQHLKKVDDTNVADEVYDRKWAMNTAKVTQLLVD